MKTKQSKTEKMIELFEFQNKLLSKNTLFTASGAVVGLVALIVSLIALYK